MARNLVARVCLLAALLVTGLAAGFFCTYADSVTRGLAITDDRTYVLAFQAINATVRTALFAVVFFGPLPLLMAAGVLVRRRAARVTLLAAAVVYGVAVIGVTFVVNVPLNEALAMRTGLDGAGFAAARAAFEQRWNEWNLVRAVAAFAAFAAVTVAALARPAASQRHSRSQEARRRAILDT